MILNNDYVLNYLLMIEREIEKCNQNNRDLLNEYANKKAYDNGDRFAENSNWSYNDFEYAIYDNKLTQYKLYIKLCDIIAESKRQNEKICIDARHANKTLININPLFGVGYYETVKQEIEQLENNPIEYPIAV